MFVPFCDTYDALERKQQRTWIANWFGVNTALCGILYANENNALIPG